MVGIRKFTDGLIVHGQFNRYYQTRCGVVKTIHPNGEEEYSRWANNNISERRIEDITQQEWEIGMKMNEEQLTQMRWEMNNQYQGDLNNYYDSPSYSSSDSD